MRNVPPNIPEAFVCSRLQLTSRRRIILPRDDHVVRTEWPPFLLASFRCPHGHHRHHWAQQENKGGRHVSREDTKQTTGASRKWTWGGCTAPRRGLRCAGRRSQRSRGRSQRCFDARDRGGIAPQRGAGSQHEHTVPILQQPMYGIFTYIDP